MKTWILGIGGSDLDGVMIMRLKGTKNQVKKHMVNTIEGLKRLEENEDLYDHGTESINEVEERDGGLYAYVCFYDHHVDLEAMPEKDVMTKQLGGK